MQQTCPKCDRLFKADERVVAVVIARYVVLKSKVCYAISQPEECLSVEHFCCFNLTEGD